MASECPFCEGKSAVQQTVFASCYVRAALQMLKSLFEELAAVFNGYMPIENYAQNALLAASDDTLAVEASKTLAGNALAKPYLDVMSAPDAHPVCKLIKQIPFDWAPPKTSSDPLYIEHSLAKAHVELLGPNGLVRSDSVRLGLYGMMPDSEYGVRTHPANEIYVMLAGEAEWKRADDPYIVHVPGERSYHPSMMEHANRTTRRAFMSVYVWHGDISTDNYHYAGVPESG